MSLAQKENRLMQLMWKFAEAQIIRVLDNRRTHTHTHRHVKVARYKQRVMPLQSVVEQTDMAGWIHSHDPPDYISLQ